MADPDPMPLEIDPADLKALREGQAAYAVVDVREAFELRICGFDEALHLPLGELEARFAELPRDRPLVVVCRTGRRSLTATEFLRQQGLAQATNLRGGVHAWAEAYDPSMPRY